MKSIYSLILEAKKDNDKKDKAPKSYKWKDDIAWLVRRWEDLTEIVDHNFRAYKSQDERDAIGLKLNSTPEGKKALQKAVDDLAKSYDRYQ
jgi:hypothetical protein